MSRIPAPVDYTSLANRIARLERAIETGAGQRRLQSASIGAGGLRILDGGDLVLVDDTAELSLRTLAFGIRTAEVSSLQSTNSTSPTDLATPGPAVPVTVSTSGRMLVTVSAEIRPPFATGSGAVTTGGHMGFQVSGATSRAPSANHSYYVYHRDDPSSAGSSDAVAASRTILVTGLNPGQHTVTAKYWKAGGTPSSSAEFLGRTIVVQPL